MRSNGGSVAVKMYLNIFLKISVIIILFTNVTISLAFGANLLKPTGEYSVGTKLFEIGYPTQQKVTITNAIKDRWSIQSFYPTIADNNTPLNKKKNFSVIVFVPDLGHRAQDYTTLCADIASYGYIVLAINIPDYSRGVILQNNSLIKPSLYSFWRIIKDNYKDLSFEGIGWTCAPSMVLKQDIFSRYFFNFYIQLIDKVNNYINVSITTLAQEPFFKQRSLNFKAIIGIGAGATMVTYIAAHSNKLLVSIYDTTDGLSLSEGPWTNFALIVRNMETKNTQYFNNWVAVVNNQKLPNNVGKKTKCKQWISLLYSQQKFLLNDGAYLYAQKHLNKSNLALDLYNWLINSKDYYLSMDTQDNMPTLIQWMPQNQPIILKWLNKYIEQQ